MAKRKQPPRAKHVPQRTCIACRNKVDKRRLTRIVRTLEGNVVVDVTGKRNGRGAYVCDQSVCWDKIVQQKGLLNQALKTAVTVTDRKEITAYKEMAVSTSLTASVNQPENRTA
ncbi:MAG: YlxR family protein [Chloroflexi bacterium]|nr:YlxR family protein [Chloroflexota bacterium]